MHLGAAGPPLTEIRRTWAAAPLLRFALPALPLAGLVLYLFWPMLAGLFVQWMTDEDYSHGFLIPPVSAYLVWERRHALTALRPRSSLWGYPLIVLAVAMLVVSEAAAFGYPGRLSLPILLAGLALFLGGREYLRILAFPIAFLLFMLPLPVPVFNAVAFPLQMFAARVATATLDLLNIPVLREGNVITLAFIKLEVTEACSGIRSLISLLALATIYAYVAHQGALRRGLLVLSAIPIAIATNSGRVALTGILAHAAGVPAAMGFYHMFSGWLVFAVGFGLLVATGRALGRR